MRLPPLRSRPWPGHARGNFSVDRDHCLPALSCTTFPPSVRGQSTNKRNREGSSPFIAAALPGWSGAGYHVQTLTVYVRSSPNGPLSRSCRSIALSSVHCAFHRMARSHRSTRSIHSTKLSRSCLHQDVPATGRERGESGSVLIDPRKHYRVVEEVYQKLGGLPCVSKSGHLASGFWVSSSMASARRLDHSSTPSHLLVKLHDTWLPRLRK